MSEFPQNPFQILDPNVRWAPSQEDLLEKAYEQLLPPLVHKIRKAVKVWRDNDYSGVCDTTKALLQFWFKNERHKKKGNAFQYYFAQREAIESIIYLYEIAKAKDKYELMRFDSSGRISTGMFPESWPRYVIKMATGSGKTKVMSLVFVWSYFHKLYEPESDLCKNFLIITPNIIVLNRLRKDFDDFKIFREDPLIPENGYFDRDWQNDFFQITLHIQDELKPITEEGNLFLTNIHRVYLNEDREPSLEEEFLGKKPPADADTSKGMDLDKVLRSAKIKDLLVMNDEAHHIHDENMQWFKSIEDINNHLKLKQGKGISLQVDYTATPKHDNGAIFVQTICDYPLVEAIKQRIVKSPVLPDEASRAKLSEKTSSEFVERYKDFIHLGYIEWKKQYDELKSQKIPILFVMTLDTKEANQTKEYLEANYSEFKNSVLLIHTNKSGEISESTATKRNKVELENLRKAADAIDEDTSPYKAVVSVMMLREGWDVRNVMTIVGLRPYGSPAKILPEQTLGRGLRKMFGMDRKKEELVVVGTPAFIEFVESIKSEGVEFGYRPMGEGGKTRNPIIVEIDSSNENKDLDKLDILIPMLSPRIHRDYKNLEDIDINALKVSPVPIKTFTENELKEIVFTDIDGVFSHKIEFTVTVLDYRNVVGFFTQSILKESRLVSGFHILYPKVEQFMRLKLFGKTVDLEKPTILRNLSELEAKQTIYQTFKKAIDDLTIKDKGSAKIKNYISLRKAKPLVVDNQPYLVPQKSVYNKIIGDSQFELEFAAFLENNCPDIISFAKNFQTLNFKIEYQAEDGNIHDFHPDFLIKKNEQEIYIAETKGREDVDDVRKIKRLQIWCNDVNRSQDERKYIPLYVKQEVWEKNQKDIKTFSEITKLFKLEKQYSDGRIEFK